MLRNGMNSYVPFYRWAKAHDQTGESYRNPKETPYKSD